MMPGRLKQAPPSPADVGLLPAGRLPQGGAPPCPPGFSQSAGHSLRSPQARQQARSSTVKHGHRGTRDSVPTVCMAGACMQAGLLLRAGLMLSRCSRWIACAWALALHGVCQASVGCPECLQGCLKLACSQQPSLELADGLPGSHPSIYSCACQGHTHAVLEPQHRRHTLPSMQRPRTAGTGSSSAQTIRGTRKPTLAAQWRSACSHRSRRSRPEQPLVSAARPCSSCAGRCCAYCSRICCLQARPGCLSCCDGAGQHQPQASWPQRP